MSKLGKPYDEKAANHHLSKTLAKYTHYNYQEIEDCINKFGWDVLMKSVRPANEGGHDLTYYCQQQAKRGKVICSIKSVIPKIYQKQFLEVSLFAWVAAIGKVLPAVSKKKAIAMYKQYFDLGPELDEGTANKIVNRMENEFYELLKGK